jgi:hypothetical protein
MEIDAVRFLKMPVNFYRIIQHHISEDRRGKKDKLFPVIN